MKEMADFAFFDSIYKTKNSNPVNPKNTNVNVSAPNITVTATVSTKSSVVCHQCKHANTVSGQYNKICIDCGIEITDEILKTHVDTNRCNIRKDSEKNIFQDVRDMNISDKVVRIANDLFIEITSENIRRGNARRSIVFACVFQAYKLFGKPQNPENLIQLFHITKSAGMRGMKYLNKHIPKDSKIRTTHITPVDIIKDIIEKFQSSPEQEKSIINIYNKIKHKSGMLKRSRPLSIASGIVFYWIEKNNTSITIEDFVKKVKMSAITIKKVAKEVKRLIDESETVEK